MKPRMNLLLACVLTLLTLTVNADSSIRTVLAKPNYSSAQYEESNIDLSVKTIGGYIKVQRIYMANSWQFNHGTKGMTFEYNREHDSVPNEITVAGVSYQLDSQSVNDSATGDDPQALYFSEADSELGINQSRIEKYSDSFKWEDNQGNWLDYNADGQITQGGNANTVTTKTVLDVQGRIFQILDAKDSLVLSYDYVSPDSSLIKQITDYTGRTIAYQYDDSDRLVRVVDALGQTWHYQYDTDGLLIKVKNPEAQSRNIFYVQGNVTAIKDDLGVGTTYSYDYNSISKQYYFRETHSSGAIKESTYDSQGVLLEQKVDGLLVRKTIETRQGIYKYRVLTDSTGNRIKQTYDQNGNMIKVERNDSSVESASYNGVFNKMSEHTNSLGSKTQFVYDAKGNIAQVKQAVGTTLERIANYAHDEYGQLTRITYQGDAETQTASYQFGYDDKGNRQTVTDPLGNITTYSHNVQGRVTSVTNPKNYKWLYTLDAVGNLLSVKGPLNRIYSAKYNKIGQRIEVIAPNGRITKAEYDHRGRTTSLSWPQNTNAVQNYIHDDVGRSVTAIDPLGFSLKQKYNSIGQISYVQDANGNQTRYHYNGLLLSQVDFPTFSQKVFYDQRNRVNKQTLSWQHQGQDNQQEHQQQYDSHGQPTLYTDALNNQTNSQYDVLGRLISRTGALGDVTKFAYDSRNNLLSVTDAENRITKFNYDRNGRKVSEIREPSVGVQQIRTYEYDSIGNLIKETAPSGTRIEHDYDAANQRIASRYYQADVGQVAGALEKTISYTYNDLGQLKSMDDGQSRQTYQYNVLGQLIETEIDFGAFSKTLVYTYDKRGKKATYTTPEGLTYQYQYDGNGNVTNVVLPQHGQISFLGYQGRRPNQILFPGGLKQLYNYDGLNREFTREVLDGAGNQQAQAVYSYDAQNNITGINSERGQHQYTYDDLYRLTTVDNPNNLNAELQDESYSYDLVHNRLTSHLFNNWTYSGTNQLLAIGNIQTNNEAYEFEYNHNGQMVLKTKLTKSIDAQQQAVISKFHTHYVYDASERLVSVSTQQDVQAKQSIVQYQYNGMGQRIAKTVSGATTYFLYDQTGLIGEYTSAGVLQAEYHYTPGSTFMTRPLFKRESMEGEQVSIKSNIYFYQNDHLGTPQKLFAKNGALAWFADYESFGKAYVGVSSTTNNLRFPGQYFDGETQTHYNYFRDYDPGLGRYIQSDPIGLKGGVNLFTYVKSTPITSFDPFGLVDIIIGGAADAGFPGPTGIMEDFAQYNLMSNNYSYYGWSEKSAIARDIAGYASSGEKINIYAHSWGATTSLDVANILAKNGINVDSLITFDGVGFINRNRPNNIENWVNVNAQPLSISDWDLSDYISAAGLEWDDDMKGIADVSIDLNRHHGDVSGMWKAIDAINMVYKCLPITGL